MEVGADMAKNVIPPSKNVFGRKMRLRRLIPVSGGYRSL